MLKNAYFLKRKNV